MTVFSPGTTFIVFDPASYTRTIPENSNTNTLVLTAKARPSGVTYSIVGGNTDNAFRIDSNNGQVFVQEGLKLDRETQETYNLRLRAVASTLAAEASATIRLSDKNDEKPRITFMETEPKNIAIEDFSPKGAYVIKVLYMRLP